jgi:hypothetical protein
VTYQIQKRVSGQCLPDVSDASLELAKHGARSYNRWGGSQCTRDGWNDSDDSDDC